MPGSRTAQAPASPAPVCEPRGRRSRFALAMVLAFAAGCQTPSAEAPKTCDVVLENQTIYVWDVRASASVGQHQWTLAPHSAMTVTLPGGHWTFCQEIPATGAARTTDAELIAGTTYRWPLATLHSGPER